MEQLKWGQIDKACVLVPTVFFYWSEHTYKEVLLINWLLLGAQYILEMQVKWLIFFYSLYFGYLYFVLSTFFGKFYYFIRTCK